MANQNNKKNGSLIGSMNISGGQVNIVGEGTINQVYNAKTNPVLSTSDFVQLIKNIDVLTENMEIDIDTKRAIQGDLRAIVVQAQRVQPQKMLITNRIKSALELVVSLGGAVSASQTIYPLLQQAYEFAKTNFIGR
jgi:hypothetical protein